MSYQYAYATPLFEGISFGKNSAILVANEKLEPIYTWQPNKLLIPASTQKIITSLMALDTWGPEHRFQTQLYFYDGWIWVKGFGDPFLVSEEIDVIAQQITEQLLPLGKVIKGIGIDSSHFANITVPGRTDVDDPYNAPVSAVSANFNTVFLNKKNQFIETAETQTPLTPTAKKLADHLSDGQHRINVGNSVLAEQHFAELLRAKLEIRGLTVKPNTILAEKPDNSVLIYKHKNSHSLEDIVKASLRYSNNFIANQLFISMPTNTTQGNLKDSQQWAKNFLLQRYAKTQQDWQSVTIDEGAGLSRKNRLSARHLLQVLNDFTPYEYLLRAYEDGAARAKTGTLENVRTFAGYINLDTPDDKKQKYYFVFLLNDPAPYKYRETLLKQLVNDLKSDLNPITEIAKGSSEQLQKDNFSK